MIRQKLKALECLLTDKQTNIQTALTNILGEIGISPSNKHTKRTNILAIFASNNIRVNNTSSGWPQGTQRQFEG